MQGEGTSTSAWDAKGYDFTMEFEFVGEAIEWRGPAPFVFVAMPQDVSDEIKALSHLVTYGWGCIPATVTIGGTTFTTSLMPRNGIYLVPVKVVVQRAEGTKVGDMVQVFLQLAAPA